MIRTYDEQVTVQRFLDNLIHGSGQLYDRDKAIALIQTIAPTADRTVALKAAQRTQQKPRRRGSMRLAVAGIGSMEIDSEEPTKQAPLPIVTCGDYALINYKTSSALQPGRLQVLPRHFATRFDEGAFGHYISYDVWDGAADGNVQIMPRELFRSEMKYIRLFGTAMHIAYVVGVPTKMPATEIEMKAERSRVGPWGPFPDKPGEPA